MLLSQYNAPYNQYHPDLDNQYSSVCLVMDCFIDLQMSVCVVVYAADVRVYNYINI